MCASFSPKSNNQYPARTSVPIFPIRDEHRSTHFAEPAAAGAHVQRHGETTIAGSELAARHDVTVVAGELGNHDTGSRRTAGA
jgi:hypothetical protein